MLGYLTIGVFALIVFWAAFFKPKALSQIYAFSLPFFGVIAEVGLQVTPVLVVALGMLTYLILSVLPHLHLPIAITPYLFYILAVCIVMSFFLPEAVSKFPPLRGEFRWVSQIIVFVLLITPVIFLYNLKPSKDEILVMLNVFIGTTVFLCFTGLAQLYIYKISGKDIFPINMFAPGEKEDIIRSALSRLSENIKVLRMSALGGGEPKHFGYTCVMAFNLLFLRWIYVGKSGIRRGLINLIIAVLLIVCVFLTLSTQSYILLGLDVILLLFLMLFFVGFKKKRVFMLLVVMGIGAFLILRNVYTRTLIEARIYNRLEETGALEDFNLTILDFLKDNPRYILFGTGLGNVHFFAYPYIPNEFKYYMRDSVFVAKAGLLRIVSEQGIVGLVLFLGIIVFLILRLSRNIPHLKPQWRYLGLCMLLVTIINFMISSDSSPFYIFSIAVCFALIPRDSAITA